MRRVLLILLVILAGWCHVYAGEAKPLTLAELAATNQAKLQQLSIGMSKDEVLAIMGRTTAKTNDGLVQNPWTVEAFSGRDGALIEVLFYVTRKHQPFTPVRKALTTPVVLRDGRVVAWGEHADVPYK